MPRRWSRPRRSPPNCAPLPPPILLCSSSPASSCGRRWGKPRYRGRKAMTLTRRDLAAAGVLVLGATALIGSAQAESADEGAVKKAVQELKTAYLKQDKETLESMTAAQLSYSHS